jgi:hypothetical protein
MSVEGGATANAAPPKQKQQQLQQPQQQKQQSSKPAVQQQGKQPAVHQQQERSKRLALFDHLLSSKNLNDTANTGLIESNTGLHPATVKVGALFTKGILQSDDDRLSSLFSALIYMIREYTTPPDKILREDLDKFICKQVRQ